MSEETSMSNKIKWARSVDNHTNSKDERFFIWPQYLGTTRTQGYGIRDTITGLKWTAYTQQTLKAEAQEVVDKEVKRRVPASQINFSVIAFAPVTEPCMNKDCPYHHPKASWTAKTRKGQVISVCFGCGEDKGTRRAKRA